MPWLWLRRLTVWMSSYPDKQHKLGRCQPRGYVSLCCGKICKTVRKTDHFEWPWSFQIPVTRYVSLTRPCTRAFQRTREFQLSRFCFGIRPLPRTLKRAVVQLLIAPCSRIHCFKRNPREQRLRRRSTVRRGGYTW
jgi:hypothetical protein